MSIRRRWPGLVLVVIGAVTGGCRGDFPEVATPFRPATGSVAVVANQDRGIATIVDLAEWRLVAHVDVDMNPHEAAASPDGRLVALASPTTWMGDARKIALLDIASASLARTLDLDSYRWPHGLAFVDDRTLVVSSRARSGIVFVDVSSGAAHAAAEAPGSEPYLLHIARPTGRIYTSSPATNTIAEYDLATRRFLRELAIPGGPGGFGVSPDGRTLWASTGTHGKGGTIVVADASSGSVRARFPIAGHARRFAFAQDGAWAIATDVIGGHAVVFDAARLQQAGLIDLGDGTSPSGVACEPASPRCYVGTIASGELVEIDAAARRVTRRIHVGSGADGVALVRR